jgi:hypothetical protein
MSTHRRSARSKPGRPSTLTSAHPSPTPINANTMPFKTLKAEMDAHRTNTELFSCLDFVDLPDHHFVTLFINDRNRKRSYDRNVLRTALYSYGFIMSAVLAMMVRLNVVPYLIS